MKIKVPHSLRSCFFFCFLVFLCPTSWAQQYISNLEHFTTEHGLSHHQINWIHQDRQGMIWIGTHNGINRYDGQEFKFVVTANFAHTHNERIIEDEEGDLWLRKDVEQNELFFFNTLTQKVKTFEEKFGEHAPFQKDAYLSGIMLANKTIVARLKSNQVISFSVANHQQDRKVLSSKGVDVYGLSHSNQFWIHRKTPKPSAKHQFLFLDDQQEVQLSFDQLPDWISVIDLQANHQLIFGGSDRFIHTLSPEGEHQKYDFGHPTTQKLSSGTSFIYDHKQDRLIKIKEGTVSINDFKQSNNPISSEYYKALDVSSIAAAYGTGETYWLGTINGLFKLQIKPQLFKKAFYQDPNLISQNDFRSCRGIAADHDGNIYVASRRAIYHLENETLAFDEDSIPRKYGLFFDKKENQWFNSNGRNIRIDAQTKQSKPFQIEGIPYGIVWSFYEDDNKQIWCGTISGLVYYQEEFSAFKAYQKYNAFPSLATKSIYQIFEDREQQIWLVSSDGLYRLDLELGVVERFWKGGPTLYAFPSNDLRHMFQDEQGIYWIASSEGLIRWDKKNGQSRLFTIHDGLADNNINAVYEDDFGFLWMSSDNGIIQFQKETHKVKNYHLADGISHLEFNRISHYQHKDGTLYFGGLNGLTYFHPADFAKRFDQPIDIPLVLSECKIFSGKTGKQEDRLEDFHKNSAITLSPEDRYLTLQFALLDYNNLKSPQYVFEMDGEQWSVTKENTINISALPYGAHQLKVKGRTGNGLFSNQTLSIPIKVLKPFYWQTWFISLAIASFLLLLFAFQKRKTQQFLQRQLALDKIVAERTQTVQKQAEELQQVNQAKSKFMANISHEFRTPLTLILNTLSREKTKSIHKIGQQNTIIPFQKMDVDIMERNAQRLQELIEQLLDLSKLEAGKMTLKSKREDFYQHLRDLVESFKPMAQSQQIELTFTSRLTDCSFVYDRDKMDKILYNLIGNALKFTPSGKNIQVQLGQQNRSVVLQIIDEGVGISREELPFIFNRFYRGAQPDEYAYEGTGLGLALVKELIEMHRGSIEVESTIGVGTTFKIQFPLQEDSFQSTQKIQVQQIGTRSPIPKSIGIPVETHTKVLADQEQPLLLIIEDNEDLLYHHQRSFEEDYQLMLANNGLDGIALAIEQVPDIIICDVMMPLKNGYEVCQELKLDERTNHIPIILLTAKADQNEKLEGLMVGADDYLTKPYNQNELEIRLKNKLKHRQLLQEKLTFQSKNPYSELQAKNPRVLFIEKCNQLIEDNLTNPNFSIDEWCKTFNMSRSQIYRKVKAIIGTTPTQYVRSYRLNKAKALLIQSVGNASEIAYRVGFSNPNYFFKCFKDEFGLTVGDFMKGE